ncbi:YiaL-like protein [Paucilactobacillus oligofermentans DSM 15707 = LMG 22743]|nr:YiaL-like protein [Paucilactobacillus oligofermentans DSM 15707 = LMG 22743]
MLFSNPMAIEIADYNKLQKAIDFLRNTDLKKTPLGRSYKEGESFYCQTLEYDTEIIDKFDFEIHEKRLDLHYIVEGEERIDVSPDTECFALSDYNDDRDIQYVKQPKRFNQVLLHKGDFILIGMHEPHRTNGMLNEKKHVRKIVLKLGR